MSIHYLKGDATDPIGDGRKVIAHISNDIGGWGAGFTRALDQRWPEIGRSYRAWAKEHGLEIPQGLVQYVVPHDNPRLVVANMIAQKGIRAQGIETPIRYDSLEVCLRDVANFADTDGSTLHMPRIGCGLAGGRWEEVEPIIQRTCGDIDVYVYDLY